MAASATLYNSAFLLLKIGNFSSRFEPSGLPLGATQTAAMSQDKFRPPVMLGEPLMESTNAAARAPRRRMTLDQWIRRHLQQRDLSGLQWLSEADQTFTICWPHKSANHWNLSDKENNVFLAYSRYKRDSQMGTDYCVMKQKLRCALRGNRKIEFLKAASRTKGSDAFRAYRLLESEHGDGRDEDGNEEEEAELAEAEVAGGGSDDGEQAAAAAAAGGGSGPHLVMADPLLSSSSQWSAETPHQVPPKDDDIEDDSFEASFFN